MNKLQAIKAMKNGDKVKHKSFTSNEWITIVNGRFLFEDGLECDFDEFWKWRNGEEWEQGWELF